MRKVVGCKQHEACHEIRWQTEVGAKALGTSHVTQVVEACTDEACTFHPDCTVIVTTQTGVLLEQDFDNDARLIGGTFDPDAVSVSTSHLHSDIHPEHRLNDTFPTATDRRGKRKSHIEHTPFCADCKEHPALLGL